jgi:hypothetical protein
MFLFKERPVWTYGMRLPYHTPAQLEAKCRWLKWMWFVLPVTLALGRGDFWTDPYDPTHPSFQWVPVIVILVWSIGGLVVYFAIRWILKLRANPIVKAVRRNSPSDRGARIPQSLPNQVRPNYPRALLQ